MVRSTRDQKRGPVIHVAEMSDLVRGEIVEHERRREH